MPVDVCRRPITEDEVPHLELLGSELRYWRVRCRLTQTELADALAMARCHVWRLEHGWRRTRPSTLAHIARVLADASRRGTDRLDAVEILSSLLAAGGPAIAPESPRSMGSIPRKRKRRTRANLKHDLAAILAVVDGPDAPPVGGGPEHKLRERITAAIDRL